MVTRKTAYVLTLFTILTVLAVSAVAQDQPEDVQPPKERFYLQSLTVARYHPLGLLTRNDFMYSRRLMESDSILFRDTYFAIGPTTSLSPAYVKVGPLIELQPIALLNLKAGYEYVYYLGTFDYLQSYPFSDASFHDDRIAQDGSKAYAAGGHHYFAEATVQMKYKIVALRSKFGGEYWDMNFMKKYRWEYLYWNFRKDRYFYDVTLDTLVPNKGFIWTNDTDLLFMKDRWVVGARFSGVFPGTNSDHMRVGPLFAWTFKTKKYTNFSRPTLLVILGWYLKHPHRIGALPYTLVGFSFSSDFLNPASN